jgi:hypothetical protein
MLEQLACRKERVEMLPRKSSIRCPECGNPACTLVACLPAYELPAQSGMDTQASKRASMKLEYRCSNAQCQLTFIDVIHDVAAEELVVGAPLRRRSLKRFEAP